MTKLNTGVVLVEDVFANIPDLSDPLVLSLYPVGALFSATDAAVIYRRDVDETWHAWATLGGIGDYICIQDQKSATTEGGTFTSGAWRTRDLNNEVADTGGHATLASNQIDLAAGTYRCAASVPAFYVDDHKARLRNVDDNTTLLVGSPEISGPNSLSVYVSNASRITGRFTLASTKTLEVQHQCATTFATQGFGRASGFSEIEVYTSIEFWKEP